MEQPAQVPGCFPADATIRSPPPGTAQIASPLSIHAAMFALADQYKITELLVYARDKFFACLEEHQDTWDFVDAVVLLSSLPPTEDSQYIKPTLIGVF